MIKRFFAIKVFSDTSDDKLIELMSTRQVENKWRGLQDDLRDFKSASKNFRATIMSRFLMVHLTGSTVARPTSQERLAFARDHHWIFA
ncbi:hypothetical protein PI124_g8246 [Phytophthora idaei]|nr:hypothetical protein PI124_g8246 [Phytophthora idaei]